MSRIQSSGRNAEPGARGARLALLWAGIGIIAILCGCSKEGLKPLAKGEMAKLVVPDKVLAPAVIAAQGPAGEPVSLADLKGNVVVVNLWASWCAPCVKEMPTLARMQSDYAGKPVKVLAISLDKGADDIAKARAFIAARPPLKFYHGEYSLAFSITPPAEGLPTTILYDRSGRERARLSGGADWSTPEARAVLDRLLTQAD